MEKTILSVVAALSIVLSGGMGTAQAASSSAVRTDLLTLKITSAIERKDYAQAGELFDQYKELGLEIPLELRVHRASVYVHLGQANRARAELEKYLSLAKRGTKNYNRVLEIYKTLNKQTLITFLKKYRALGINSKDKKGNTPLHHAADENVVEVATLLISLGANVDAEANERITPLHLAAHTNAAEVAELLIDKGAHVNKLTIQGNTALHLAAFYNATKVVSVLLENGANVHARNGRGSTPLHYAASSNSTEALSLLIKKGAKLNVRNRSGQTPLHRAVSKHATEATLLLIKNGANVHLR